MRDIVSKIEGSPELRLLAQDNLPLYAAINNQVFGDVGTTHVSYGAYIHAIETVLEEFAKYGRGDHHLRSADHHYKSMLGRFASYKKDRGGEPWIGTEVDKDTGGEFVVLLPSAANALEILRSLNKPKASVGASSLDSLTERLSHVVSKVAGDQARQIEQLTIRRDKIDAEIAELKRKGAQPMQPHERQAAVENLLNDLDQIRSGFSQVPRALRSVRKYSDDLFMDMDRPKHEINEDILERKRDWEKEPEFRILNSLYALEIDRSKKERLTEDLEAMARMCEDILTPEQMSQMSVFWTRMTSIAQDVHAESSQFWGAMFAHLSSPEFMRRRKDFLSVQRLMKVMDKVTKVVQPSPQDRSVYSYGFKVPDVTRVPLLCDIKLTHEMPEAPEPEVVQGDGDLSEAAVAMSKEAIKKKALKTAYLSKSYMEERLEELMKDRKSVFLSEILVQRPLVFGEEEVLAWINLGSQTVSAVLAPARSFVCTVEHDKGHFNIQCPDILFVKDGEPGQGYNLGGDIELLDNQTLSSFGVLSHPHVLKKEVV